MKKLIIALMLCVLLFVSVPKPATAFEWPSECIVPHWNVATLLVCSFWVACEVFGVGGEGWPT